MLPAYQRRSVLPVSPTISKAAGAKTHQLSTSIAHTLLAGRAVEVIDLIMQSVVEVSAAPSVTQVRKFPDRGRPSPRYGHLGMWNLGLGPHGAIPSQRLEIVILDQAGVIVRRFEQIRGACTDPGYVDFFLSHNCRSASHLYPLVDIDENGKCAAVLCENYTESMGFDLYLKLVDTWVKQHGKTEWAIPADVRAGEIYPRD